MQINVLGTPPTSEALRAGCVENEQRWNTYIRDKRIVPFAYGVSGFCILAAIYLDSMWQSTAAVVLGLVIFAILAKIGWERQTPRPAFDASAFEPIGPYFAERILNAIEVDPRLDAYRLAVVGQGREMTVLEAQAFEDWRSDGFHKSQVMATVRAATPVRGSSGDAGRVAA